MERPYSIVLADGHQLIRQGIKKIIEEMDQLQIVGEAATGDQLLEIIRSKLPDLIIVDISVPSRRDIEAIRKIKALFADVKLLFLSMHEHQEYLDYALQNGAEGFVIKQNVDVELSQAIEKIRNGETYITPVIGHPGN